MSDFRSVGVLGGGLIGMSWASLFLARGLDVTVVDPDPDTAQRVTDFVADAWPHLRTLGLAQTGTPPTAHISTDIAALADVEFVQENGPDRIDLKRDILRQLEETIGSEIPIASSTSSLMASDLQEGALHPARILVAHPMNPPHLVPMVELVGGRATSEATVELAEAFYAQMRRVTLRVKKEVPGHLANRLTSALYREAVYLVAEGIADVETVDRAIAYGPGMRWAFMGPHLTYHLGGGAGGYQHYLDHLGPTQEARWQALGTASLTPELKNALVQGVEDELKTQNEDTLVQRRDAALVDLIRLKAEHGL
ncbi:putative 3-hydroxybutyryl-CoA dehydrogenase [Sulfitobacter noctilucae]|uniref:3-hydroxyacyl-CoA dehydrogenase NAD-binding domain-containing protein n=1 Tax=Sulfitobacter noctilucae TaxID=1342302 RepID=UPI00046AD1BA|nr:3-hydroxyacyl-CoA dehydrogenase NAD-binding domain-containing protein [Sulfitobacter noctilucae]KIN74958.1 putative 3-hydroxybutyryl-CoA dehydrogenase [Sulfitobacter noctilucae]